MGTNRCYLIKAYFRESYSSTLRLGRFKSKQGVKKVYYIFKRPPKLWQGFVFAPIGGCWRLLAWRSWR
jgi:hypothetical protein